MNTRSQIAFDKMMKSQSFLRSIELKALKLPENYQNFLQR
uniref:Uncharacterized protein n=1 Tax=Tetranychus urticae TaxID=32264 RepID=T1K2A2_TETUR